MLTARHCDECGRRFQQQREHSVYCSSTCRKTANERRISGGYRLYPLVMRWRIERPADALNELCVEADRLANIEREIRAKRQARIVAGNLPSESGEVCVKIKALETALSVLPETSKARAVLEKELRALRVHSSLADNHAIVSAKRAKKEAA